MAASSSGSLSHQSMTSHLASINKQKKKREKSTKMNWCVHCIVIYITLSFANDKLKVAEQALGGIPLYGTGL